MTRSSATFEVVKSEEEWRRLLTPEQYSVLREHGTDPGGKATRGVRIYDRQ